MSLGRMSLKIVLGADVSSLRAALAKALSYLGTYKQMIADINKRYPGLIVNISAAAAYYSSLGYTIKRAVDHARDFEFWMFRIKSLFAAVQSATEDVTEAYEDMRKEALRIGRTTVYSASQAADAMGKLIEAGFTSAEAIRAVGDVLKFAAISGLSLERASIIAVQILRAFGMEAEQLNKALGVMTIAAVESTGRISDMALSLGYVAGVAGELGLSIEETAMWVGLLTNVLTTTVGTFMQAGKAGRYLRTLLMQLSDPDVVRRLEAIGIQIWDESGERMRSLTAIIQDFRELAGQMTKRELFWLADQLGLSQVAATALYYAMRADTDVVGRFQKELQDVSDWQRIYYERSQSLNWELQRLKNVTDVLWITMGESMLPAVHRLVEAFTKLAEEGSPAETVIRGIGKGISEALLDPLSEAVQLFAELSDAVKETGYSLEDFGRVMGHLAVVAPVLLLIAKYIHPGLAVALAAAYAAWESNFLGMRDIVGKVAEEIKPTIKSAMKEFIAEVKGAQEELEKIDLMKPLRENVEHFLKGLDKLKHSIYGFIGELLAGIVDAIAKALTGMSLGELIDKYIVTPIKEKLVWLIDRIRDLLNLPIIRELGWAETLRELLFELKKKILGVAMTQEELNREVARFRLYSPAVRDYANNFEQIQQRFETYRRATQQSTEAIRNEMQNIAGEAKMSVEGMMQQYEAWKMAVGRPGFEYEMPQQGTVIRTDSVVNIENVNIETPYDIDAMAWEMGYLTAEELRRRGIQIG